MKAKDLLIPRFEVIAHYPNSKYNIGDIIETTEEFLFFLTYPHLFRKLNWWEKRTKEQMPSKLKSLLYRDNPDFDLEKE